MVWQGKDVVKQGRAMIGATNPLVSLPGCEQARERGKRCADRPASHAVRRSTIRGDYCIEVGRNGAWTGTGQTSGAAPFSCVYAGLPADAWPRRWWSACGAARWAPPFLPPFAV